MSSEFNELSFKIGQLIFPSIKGFIPNKYNLERYIYYLEKIGIGGLILNSGSVCQLKKWFPDFIKRAKKRLIISADMEHGVGEQFEDYTRYPSALAIGKTENPNNAKILSKYTAIQAKKGFVNCIYAPVADINTNPDNPIINIRSFGNEIKCVSNMVKACIEGFHEGGVLACAKHYPRSWRC